MLVLYSSLIFRTKFFFLFQYWHVEIFHSWKLNLIMRCRGYCGIWDFLSFVEVFKFSYHKYCKFTIKTLKWLLYLTFYNIQSTHYKINSKFISLSHYNKSNAYNYENHPIFVNTSIKHWCNVNWYYHRTCKLNHKTTKLINYISKGFFMFDYHFVNN
jgi:hypothetical protein